MKRLLTGLTAVLLCAALISVPLLQAIEGEHNGEVKQLDVSAVFSNPSGFTITNAEGTFYNYWGYTFKEDKVYLPQYWGNFPLYFLGEPVPVTVTVTNIGPRARTKVRVITESYVLKTDGSNGAVLAPPKTVEIELAKGETRTIDASFTTQITPDADSGLDRVIVKVQHVNEGGGPGNPEPALILVKEAVFCPPKYMPKK